MRRGLVVVFFATLLFAPACRQDPPASSAADAKANGDESERQSQRADDQKAVNVSTHTGSP